VEAPYGVMIAVEMSELPPGRHGFHIHEVGRCDPPDFGSAGGHFNPRGKRHGLMTVEGPHVGDLPNLVAGSDGTARAEFYLTHATVGAGSNSLFHPNGTASSSTPILMTGGLIAPVMRAPGSRVRLSASGSSTCAPPARRGARIVGDAGREQRRRVVRQRDASRSGR